MRTKEKSPGLGWAATPAGFIFYSYIPSMPVRSENG